MTDDDLREALETMMSTPPCPHCGALTGLVVPRGGAVAIPFTVHDDDCIEAA